MLNYYFSVLFILFVTSSSAQFGTEQVLMQKAWASESPNGIEVKDLDNDGDLDLITCSYASDYVAWHENLGGGEFGPSQIINNAMTESFYVDGADINGDGLVDIVARYNAGTVWFENLGGSFSSTPLFITFQRGDFKLADFDNDGDIDLFGVHNNGTNVAVVALNQGTGVFDSPIMISPTPQSSGRIDLGDIDNDGDIDLLSSSRNQDGTLRFVCWIENLGASFGSTHIISTASTIESGEIVATDADQDGDIDIAVAEVNSNKLTLFKNLGAGSFNSGTIVDNTISDYTHLEAADLNSDGKEDLIATHYNFQNNSIRYFLNTGGNYTAYTLSFAPYSLSDISVGDMDEDGDIDIILSSQFNEICWIENDGSATFGEVHYISVSAAYVSDLSVVDINNDGYDDIIYTTNTELMYYKNNLGQFDYLEEINGAPGNALSVSDFDNNGFEDILVVSSSNPEMNVYSQLPSGEFSGPEQIFNGGSSPIITGAVAVNLDNNGFDDLLCIRNGSVYKATNDGVNWQFSISPLTGNSTTSVYPYDVNEDGNMDFIYTSQNSIYWGENLGGGNFSVATLIAGGLGNGKNVLMGDFDGDGISDIVGTGYNYIRFFKGLGGLTYGAPVMFNGAGITDIREIEAKDLDDDDDLDLIAVCFNTGKLVWYENLGNGSFGTPSIITTNSDGAIAIEVTDVDLDSDNDIIVVSYNDQKIAWFENYFYHPNQVRGKIFIDMNQSGTEDSTDVPMQFTQINCTPQSTFGYTYMDGRYFLNFADSANGNYFIAPEFLADWGITTDSLSYTVYMDSSFVFADSLDFGMYPTVMNDSITVQLDGASSGCNTNANYWLNVHNAGTTFPSGVIQVVLDDSLTFVSASILPDSVVGQNIYWSYDSLFYFDVEIINLIVQMPSFLSMGSVLESYVIASVDSIGSPVFMATDTLSQVLTCAYDPNDKFANPEGIEPDGMGYIPETTISLDYTIRFQNTGTDTAYTIKIKDQLDNNLVWSSLEVLSSSHSYNVDFSPTGEITFEFEDINLPDSNANFLGSQGFIKYNIEIQLGAIIPAVINNTAEIYFDLNPPVITNTEINTLFNCETILDNVPFPQYTCENELLEITVPGDSTTADYIWQLDTLYSQMGQTFSWVPDTSGSFDLKLNIASPVCLGDTTIQVIIYPVAMTTVLPTTSICSGDSILIFNEYQYIDGIFSDTLNTSYGCDSIVIQELIVQPIASINFDQISNDTLCLSASTLSLSANPTGGNFSGAGVSSNAFDPDIAGVGNHIIYYTYVDSSGCSTTDSLNLTVENCLELKKLITSSYLVYPNPTSGQLTIDFGSLDNKIFYVSVIDITGRVIPCPVLSHDSKIQLDMSHVSRGVFFVLIENIERSSLIQSTRIIVK